jgi:rRNA maturation endonuclease Nob1
MDPLTLLIGLLLLIGLILFVAQPLRRAQRASASESELDALSARRESLYTQIRELDFDHATGKVTDADYAPLRARLVAQAAEVLRAIDALQVETPDALSDDTVEAQIVARRKRKPARAATFDEEIEAAIAARRHKVICPNCGKAVNRGDAFCAKCGSPLGTQVSP